MINGSRGAGGARHSATDAVREQDQGHRCGHNFLLQPRCLRISRRRLGRNLRQRPIRVARPHPCSALLGLRQRVRLSPRCEDDSPFYGGVAGVARRLALAREDTRAFFLRSAPRTMARAYAPGDETAGMHFALDYHADPARGAISAWTNEMAPLSSAHWLLFDGLSAAAGNRIPTLMIHGPGCARPDNAKDVFERFSGPEELVWIEGEQIDFYDEPQQVDPSVAAIHAWFGKHLSAPGASRKERTAHD